MSTDLKRLEDGSDESLMMLAVEEATAAQEGLNQVIAIANNAVKRGRLAGKCLNIVKARTPHGKWLPLLDKHWPFDRTWATRLMKISNEEYTPHLEHATTLEECVQIVKGLEEAAGTKRTRKPPAAPASEVEVIDNRPTPSRAHTATNATDETDDGEEKHTVQPVASRAHDATEAPPLLKTNTHHTTQNRRLPDARETDRAGIVSPDDPRGLQDGCWYVWSEERNRLLPVTDDDILRRADGIRGQMVVGHAVTTSPVVEPTEQSASSKRFTPPTADEVASYSDEINAGVDGQQFVDFYESKGWMIGKNKMKDWKAAVRTWKRSENQRGSKITTAVRSNRNWDEEIPEWKPTE